MLFPEAFRRLMDMEALPNLGKEFVEPILLIVEAVVLEVNNHLYRKTDCCIDVGKVEILIKRKKHLRG